jgi:hypothetical protein
VLFKSLLLLLVLFRFSEYEYTYFGFSYLYLRIWSFSECFLCLCSSFVGLTNRSSSLAKSIGFTSYFNDDESLVIKSALLVKSSLANVELTALYAKIRQRMINTKNLIIIIE